MNTSLTSRRPASRGRIIRKAGWVASAAMLVVAVLAPASVSAAGPGNNGLDATGNGTKSNATAGGSLSAAGSSATIGTAILFCSGTNAGSLTGTITLSKTLDVGSTITLYLAPNNGSNATPLGNVSKNEETITLTAANNTSGSVIAYTLSVTSPFTVSSGGILVVFAVNADGTTSISSSKSNSLNCTEATPTPTPTIAPTATPTGTELPIATATPTGSELPVVGTPTFTGGVEGITGTPGITPPPTDTLGAAQPTPSNDGWRIVLIGIAGILVSVLTFTQPQRVSRKR